MAHPPRSFFPAPRRHPTQATMSARPESQRTEARIDALRVPPQSVEAEQAVIGGLMLAPDSLDRVGDFLTEHDFYRRDHRLIYRAIRELSERGRPFDAVTLGEWFDANGLTEQVGGMAYLAELARFGVADTCRRDPVLALGVNTLAGHVADATVAEALGRPHRHLAELLAG